MRSGEKPLHGHLLISHTHWDHIQGLPFFAPLFVPGNEWDVYAPHGVLAIGARNARRADAAHLFPGRARAARRHDPLPRPNRRRLYVGDIKVRTQYLNHPALTLGYRLEADGVTVVYCCDHEPHSRPLAYGSGEIGGQDQRHADSSRAPTC